MDLLDLASDVARVLAAEGRLVQLGVGIRTIFVGDIHGDLDAAERVLSDVRRPGDILVFLGDIVDRGPASRECLARVLRAKLESPRSVHILMGNHEAWGAARFRPADFWESLSAREVELLAPALLALPFAARHPSGLLAVHGALPDLDSVDGISTAVPGSAVWRDLTWGDWSPERRPIQTTASRPLYGPGEFAARSARLGVRVLVRSHQPDAPTYLFDDRCLTLFTSSAYGGCRRVAVLLPERRIDSARDLDLIDI
jgi:hypothetical protein